MCWVLDICSYHLISSFCHLVYTMLAFVVFFSFGCNQTLNWKRYFKSETFLSILLYINYARFGEKANSKTIEISKLILEFKRQDWKQNSRQLYGRTVNLLYYNAVDCPAIMGTWIIPKRTLDVLAGSALKRLQSSVHFGASSSELP